MSEFTTLFFDEDLVRRYDRPGPRYTSYPPATAFRDAPEPDIVDAAIQADDVEDNPLSIYFHIPFCQSLCRYCGCTTLIGRQRTRVPGYLDALEKEIETTARLLSRERPVVQLHFGGGTPNYLLEPEIERIGDALRKHFVLRITEGSVEVDPRTLDRTRIRAFRSIGCSRASVGVQDFAPEVQRAVNRVQPFDQTKEAVECLRAEGFTSINIDLIYGLPKQNPETFEQTIHRVLSLNPDRLAIFSYAHVPWLKPAQRSLEPLLPSPEVKIRLFKTAVETLTAAGYEYVGLDHFALPGDALARARVEGRLRRNFQGYSAIGDVDLFGMGMSAISQTARHYRQNHKDLPGYLRSAVSGKLPVARTLFPSREERAIRDIIHGLMCDLQLDLDHWKERWQRDFSSDLFVDTEALAEAERDGLIRLAGGILEVTVTGRLFLRNLAMAFDPAVRSETARYSQTV